MAAGQRSQAGPLCRAAALRERCRFTGPNRALPGLPISSPARHRRSQSTAIDNVRVPDKESEKREPAVPASKELGAVLGRILDQLSLSAWMPGIAAVAGIAFLVACRLQTPTDGSLDAYEALRRLTHITLGTAVALLGAVIIATLLAQAFEFETIRTLEGYWSGIRLAWLLTTLGVNIQSASKSRKERRCRRLEKEAFSSACPSLVIGDPDVLRQVKAAWKAKRKGRSAPSTVQTEALYLLEHWREAAEPRDLRLLEATERSLEWYPTSDRLLPTKLGNTLRAGEDSLTVADGGDVQGFILRNYSRISPQLLVQLSAFRTRLDMYCTLMLVWTALGLLSIPALWQFHSSGHAANIYFGTVTVALTVLSYRSAIASAKGYVSALRAADRLVTRSLETEVASSAGDLTGG